MSQALDILFNLLEKKWTDTHMVTGATVSAAAGLVLPFWGAILNAIKWFKDYSASSKRERAEKKAAELSQISKIIAEAIKKEVMGVEDDKSNTESSI